MKKHLNDLYNGVDIDKFTNFDLQVLAEQCAAFEERVYAILDKLSTEDRQVIEVYIDLRNDLEYESVNAALRWGMHHPKITP